MRQQYDRLDFQITPDTPAWYGILYSDGAGEIWIGAGYCDCTGPEAWRAAHKHAYARSLQPFFSEQAALDWAHAQPD